MNKKSKKSIFKICFITLLIILSTIGIVLAATGAVTKKLELDEGGFKDSLLYKNTIYLDSKPPNFDTIMNENGVSLSYSNSTGNLQNPGAYHSLKSFSNILCCEHGYRLSDHPQYIVTTYNFTQGSAAQSYILSHLGNVTNTYYSDVQKAWWALIDHYGIKGSFEYNNKEIGSNEFKFELNSGSGVSKQEPGKAWGPEDVIQYGNYQIVLPKDVLEDKIREYAGDENFSKYYSVFENMIYSFAPVTKMGNVFVDNNVNMQYVQNAISSYSKFTEDAGDLKKDKQFYIDYFSEKTTESHENPCKKITPEAKEAGWDKKQYSTWYGTNKSINMYRVERVFGVHTNLDESRANYYENMMNKGLNKEQIDEFLVFILGLDTDIIGYEEEWKNVTKNLYEEALEYEKFYNGLKENNTISIDITNSTVKESSELNAFIVGPITINYNSTNKKYGYIENFKISTDKGTLTNQYISETGLIERALGYDEYALVKGGTTNALCGGNGYNFPDSGEEFYIVFSAGNGATQLTELGYNYSYILHQSSYLYYDLLYNGLDCQDLAEVYSANLWKETTDVTVDFPIDRIIRIKKEVSNPTNQKFYFDIYLECDSNVDYENKVEYEGKEYYKYTDTFVQGGNTVTVDLPQYEKSTGAPCGLVIETDQYHEMYTDSPKENSLWNDYEPAENNGVYEFDGISEGTVEIGYNQNNEVTVKNNTKPKFAYLSIDKKMTSNKDNETFYAKLDVTTRNSTYTAIIPLRPSEDSNAGYKVYYTPDRVDANGYYICSSEYFDGAKECGVVTTGKFGENDLYIHAKWEYQVGPIYDIEQNISYKVCEVAGPDENYIDYSTAINQGYSEFWTRYKSPEYSKVSGTIKLFDEYGESDKSASAVILNKINEIPIHLELRKKYDDGNTSDDKYKFNISLTQDTPDTDGENVLDQRTVEVKANNEDVAIYDKTFYPSKGKEYYMVVEEQDSLTAKWTNIEELSNEGWNIDKDEETGTIKRIYHKVSDNFSDSLVIVNTIDKGKFTIKKFVGENTDKYFEENQDEYFTFRIEANRGSISLDDFEEDDIENGFVYEKDGKVYIKIGYDNKDNGVTSKYIYWNKSLTVPTYELYEVDEEGNTYLQWIELGANRPSNSIWNKFVPKDGGHYFIELDKEDTTYIDCINTPVQVEKKFTITKTVDGTWDDRDEFYFRILSLDGTKTNVVEEYFEKDDIKTVNGLKVVKVTKEKPTVTSKSIKWKSIEQNPQFWVTEVDQYGKPWSKVPENENSIWNYYTPEHYGTWTCQLVDNATLDLNIEAKNTSNQVTLKKVIETEGEYTTEQFFKECPEAEFRFKFYDEKGNDVTKTYFETDKEGYIVINGQNYTTGVTSKPIATSKGNAFMFIESLKDENLYETAKTLIVNFDEDNRIVEAEYVNKINKRLIIDKIVEGAKDDDFLDDEEFFFKVLENGKSVTDDLFGTETVVVTKDDHVKGGVPSRVIYGNHTYEIVEYDNDGRSYEEYQKLSDDQKNPEDFWNKFKPSNNGKWTVSLNDIKGPRFVKAVNYLVTSITIEKELKGENITEADKKQEFQATVVITLNEDTKWFMVGDVEYSKNTTQQVFTKEVTISANKSEKIDNIYWKGGAPTYQVYENSETIPEHWSLDGYRVNDEFKPQSSPQRLNGEDNNAIVIQNEKDTTDLKLNVAKTIVDQNGKPTTSEKDMTFYFDVYVEPVNAKYNGIDIESIAKAEDYNPGKYNENGKYIRIDTLEVFIPAGSTHATKDSYIIDGNEVKYKIVEVDKAGHMYGDKECTEEDSLWKKFEPTMFSNGKWGNREGVWTGILNNSNPTASAAKIDAYNKVTKVNINLEKWVWYDNKLQPIKEKEVFKFIVEYTSSIGREIPSEEIFITIDKQEWPITLELERGEIIDYVITEVDPDNDVTYKEYLEGADSGFWKQFTPKENGGVIKGTVDGSKANITLIGKNDKNVHGWIAITKDVSTEWLENEEFEFQVFDGEENVTERLFGKCVDTEGNSLYNSENDTIKVTFDTKTLFSNEDIWSSGTDNPKYTIKEVNYDKTKWNPTEDIKTVTLKDIDIDQELTEEDAVKTAVYAGFTNEEILKYDQFEINKVVEKTELGSISYTDTFYAIITDKDGNNVLDSDDNIFTGEDAYYTEKELSNGTKAIELKQDQNARTRVISWKVSDKEPSYTVTEVDLDGKTYNQGSNNPESVWKKGYKPSNGTGIYDVNLVGQNTQSNLVTSIVTVTNKIDDKPIKYSIIKSVEDGNGAVREIIEGEHFYFIVEDSKGNIVTDKLFKNDINNDSLIELSVDKKSVTTDEMYTKEKYKIIETDEHGHSYEEYQKLEEESIWKEYQPSDGKGIWKLDEEQTTVNALNKKTQYKAKLYLHKQRDTDADDWSYEFTVNIDGNKENVELTKENPSWTKELKWNSTKGAPKVSINENGASDLDVTISINGTPIKQNEEYQLANKDEMSYTFDIINHEETRKAHFNLIKNGLNSNEIYRFKYAYSKDGENWITDDNYVLDIKADGMAVSSEDITWDLNESVPKFKVWEVGKVSDGKIIKANLEDITATNAGDTQKIENDTGIEGTLNSDVQVIVTATNGPDHYGDIKVVKEFVNSENKQGDLGELLSFLAEQYSKKGIDPSNVKFKFVLNIGYGLNSNNKFVIGKQEYSNHSIEKEISLNEFIDLYNNNQFNNNETDIITVENIGWSGKAPSYSIDEFVYTNSFWEPNITTNNGSGVLKCKECDTFENENKYIKVKVRNTYDWFERHDGGIKLLTSLAGNVWVETPNMDKGTEEMYDGIMNTEKENRDENNVLINPKDSGATNVYAVPHRYVVNTDGEIINDLPNGQYLYEYKFMLDDSKFYDYIDNENGSWKFDNVYVPAFDLSNNQEKEWYEKGYKVKYVIEFYYDGVKYEPTKPLVEGSADEYLQLNNDYEKYFDNSCAIENDRANENGSRTWYNAKFATVQGLEKMNATGQSKGEILSSNSEQTATVDYQTEGVGNIDGSSIVRSTTSGTINITKPVQGNIENINYLKDNFMCASTKELELEYFFKDISLSTESEELGEITSIERSVDIDPSDGREKIKITYNHGDIIKFIEVDYAQHINLGLIEREQADVQIDKKIESATLIINDKVFTYTYKNSNSNEIKENEKFNDVMNQFTRTVSTDDELYAMIMKDVEKNQKELNIYTSDYYYRTSMYNGTEVKDAFDAFYNAIYGTENEPDAIKTKELQVYLTYSITVQNQSGQYGVVVNSIDDYYDSNLTFVDVGAGYGANVNGINDYKNGPGLWAYIEQDEKEHKELTNVFAEKKAKYYENTFTGNEVTNMYAVNDKFNKMTINKSIDLPAGESSVKYYVTYRVNKSPENLDDGIVVGIKNNVAEITSFTPYLEKDNNGNITKYAAVIDKDSAPGNYNIEDETTKLYMEDDTDMANINILIPTKMTPRSISGTAWLDQEDDNNMIDGQKLGDSKLNNDDYRISGINTKLVEVIDLPIRKDENGNFVYSENDYTEYEFYWNGTETTTGEDGFYEFKNYVDSSDQDNASGVIRNSLVPGNYVVRFFYGDKDTGLYAVSENADTTKKIIRINGEDYKTTAYQKDKQDLSNDNYIQNEWHDINSKDNDNNARDNEARRLQIIKETQTLSNNNTAVFEVANYADAKAYADAKIKEAGIFAKSEQEYIIAYNEYVKQLYGTSNEDGIKVSNIKNGSTAYSNLITSDGYYMFADTAKMNLKVENQEEKDEEDVKPAGIKVENVNLGLEERSRTKMYLDKQAEEITLTTSSGKTFFHVVYDIDYVVEEVENIEKFDGKIQNRNKKDGYEYNLIDFDKDDKLAVWVGLKLKGEVIGANNLQALDDNMNVGKIITQGFRYINIDSTVLQGLKLDIRYRFTAINLSETDTYGKGIEYIMKAENNADRIDRFNTAINELSSPDYTLAEEGDNLLFENSGHNKSEPKKYGEYLGHTYYQGFNDEKDNKVRTTTHQIVDYIDNDIEFDALANTAWGTEENTEEQLRNRVDAFVFVNGKIQDQAEVDYKAIVTSIDSETTNGEFVKPLEPKYKDGTIILDNDPDNNVIATTTISTSKLFASTDKGNTGMDNFAEILVIENTVGRRDMSTVYGNYDPRGGATSTTDRDETSTEIVTLSPPTGNEENDRTMLIVISIICGVAVISGTAVGFKKKFSGKSKSKTE